MLVLAAAVWPADLQNSRGAVAKPDREHQRRTAVHRVTVEGEIPLAQRCLHEPGQVGQPLVTADRWLRVATGHQCRERFWDNGAQASATAASQPRIGGRTDA